jgi:hypothetical protein
MNMGAIVEGQVVTESEKVELGALRNDVKKDMQLAIANFKIWLLATVLSNVVLIGVPALYVFFTTTEQTRVALDTANGNAKEIDNVNARVLNNDSRLQSVERHLKDRDGYEAPAPIIVLSK